MANWKVALNSLGMVSLAISGIMAKLFLDNIQNNNIIIVVLLGCLFLPTVMTALMLFHAASMDPASSHSVKSLLATYLFYQWVIPIFGGIFHPKILRQMENPQTKQDELLMEILAENGQTDCAIDFGLDKVKSRTEFTQNCPITQYPTYQKYVDRIANGEQNIMTKEKVIFLLVTAGTTGRNKWYPLTNKDLPDQRQHSLALFYNKAKYQGVRLGRDLFPSLYLPEIHSKAGVPIGGIAAARKVKLLNDVLPGVIREVHKEEPVFFVKAIFGLSDQDVGILQGFCSDLMISFFKCMMSKKDLICKAIAAGCIEPYPDLDENVRLELNKFLSPDPARAAEVQTQLERGNIGLAKRLWPNLTFANVASTGSFLHGAKILEKTYLKGVRRGWGLHAASEGVLGICMSEEDLERELYTFLPRAAFLEFIKVEDLESQQPKTYLLSELEIGQSYEVLVTNWHGVYRYRFGDVIKVMGFTKNCPKYSFEYRTGEILNLGYEMTPAKAFYNALSKSEQQWKTAIYNYTTTESTVLDEVTEVDMSAKKCYNAFIEISDGMVLTSDHEVQFDENLCEQHEYYSRSRKYGYMGPVKLVQVTPGTFDGLRSIMYGNSTNPQYKPPRVIRRTEWLKFLWQNRLHQIDN